MNQNKTKEFSLLILVKEFSLLILVTKFFNFICIECQIQYHGTAKAN